MVDLVKARKKANEKKAELSSASARDEAQKPQMAEPQIVPATPTSKASSDLSAEVVPAETTPASEIVPFQESNEKAFGNSGRVLRRLEEIKASLGTKRLFAANVSTSQAAAGSETQLELLLFSISGETYAVSIDKIVEIIEVRTATRVPNADESIVGIISLRGTIVTILDLRRRLGHSILAAVQDETRIVVVEQEGETAGFVVDKVSRVVRIDPGIVGPPPTLADSDHTDLIHGVFQHGNNLAILLDLEKLLRS